MLTEDTQTKYSASTHYFGHWFHHIQYCKMLRQDYFALSWHTPYHIKNTEDFVSQSSIQNLRLDDDDDDDAMVLYDVTALFTSVTVDAALTVIKERLESDTTLNERTDLNSDQIIELFRFVLTASHCTLSRYILRTMSWYIHWIHHAARWLRTSLSRGVWRTRHPHCPS